jgi:archaellum component FlaC
MEIKDKEQGKELVKNLRYQSRRIAEGNDTMMDAIRDLQGETSAAAPPQKKPATGGDERITQSAESFEEMDRKVNTLIRELESASAKVSKLSDANNRIVDHITSL